MRSLIGRRAALAAAVAALAALSGPGARTIAGSGSGAAHFTYGSIGAEAEDGLPYWIWQAMPVVCGDRLDGRGYSAAGLVWEPGRELPVGFSKRASFGGERVAVNCAFCHTATYRRSASAPVQFVPGGPSTRTSPQAYFDFLAACAASDAFAPDPVLAAIDRLTDLGWADRLLYRFVYVPGTKKALAKRSDAMAWTRRQPAWGPGRVDPFNPLKFGPLALPVDASVGASDMVPLWQMAARDDTALHWDGVNPSLHALMLSSALANGATPKSIDLESLAAMEAWVRDAPLPPYPFEVDSARAAAGAAVFARDCAACHAPRGARTGTVIPIGEVGTDRHRLDSFTIAAAEGMNRLGAGTRAAVTGFRKTNGYVAAPLAGVWLRAPYLHNGSVPSLADLLSPEAERPAVFHRGYDVYDPDEVGFVSSGPAAERGFRFDTTLPGNGNRGHTYGTTLSADEKKALIEYLKTM